MSGFQFQVGVTPFTVSIPGEHSGLGPVPHMHREYVEGCFRCDLSRDEVGSDADV